MRKNIIRAAITVVVLLLQATTVCAQNHIDQMVNNFSALGSSKFTSVVERNPATGRIQKVVKVLEVTGPKAASFRKVFLKEKETGSFSQQQEGEEQTLTLSCENSKQVRLYMLRTTGRTVVNSAKVTIIVKIKKT
jgi:hypothetical protein